MKVLVIGGTGFIGKRLVKHLLDEGNDVAIASSGKRPNPFGDRVSLVRLDRFDAENLREMASGLPHYDLLYDQIGFGPDNVADICSAFRGKIDHYIFTSSGSVYTSVQKAEKVEEDFDAASSEPREGGMKELGYAEGKRSAESYLYHSAPFPFAAVRFPMVMGHDDVTKRLQFHVNRVLEGKEIVIPPNCRKLNFIWVEDAGRFLAWIGTNRKIGSYNAASSYSLDAREVVLRIAEILGRKPVILDKGDEKGITPYCMEADFIMNPAKAEKEGFEFTDFDRWFPEEVRKIAEAGGWKGNI